MARYLVTGGCGFIGSHLTARLAEAGHEVTVLDDLSTGSTESLPASVSLIVGCVTQPATVAGAMAGNDGCFHLAAVASVQRSHEEWRATHEVNLGGTINVFEAAREAGPGRRPIPVVYASSAAVYGDSQALPLSEDGPLRPLSAYGADKLGCELHARVADGVHGVSATGFRFFNVYGPRQNPASPYSGVISIFADRVLRGQPLMIFGDGEQTRDFVYVGDLIWYLTEAMERARPGAPVFNLCTGLGVTVNHLAQTLAEVCERLPEIVYAPARVGEIRASVGNPIRAITEYGFACDTSLHQGLRQTLRWLSNE
ncbi:UDP-glucose 4-epimerase [uncultured Gammaproteobacteria bacterium]